MNHVAFMLWLSVTFVPRRLASIRLKKYRLRYFFKHWNSHAGPLPCPKKKPTSILTRASNGVLEWPTTYPQFVCLFVCLFKRLNRLVTRFSPEWTRLQQSPSQAHKEPIISMLIETTTPNNQREQFYYQPQHMRKENLNQIKNILN